MQTFSYRAFDPQPGVAELRCDIRTFIEANMPDTPPAGRTNSWQVSNADFSRKLGAAGFVGMLLPKAYGGHERQPMERYIVLEELLTAGAPVGAHWISDRQTAPLILRYGTDAQKDKYLRGMAKGELFACIGLSEPNAGSDLASVRTFAKKTDKGWVVNGQKVWTTNAHHAHVILALIRTQEGSERQEGLSQFLIDMDTPGVDVRPIIDLAGKHDFNEIFFDNVELPHGALIGVEGEGWKQATAELALERSGPERYLSSHAMFEALIDFVGPDPDPQTAALIGRLSAELWTLRQMSMSVAAKLAAGEDPMYEASIVKDLGNSFEQTLPVAIQSSLDGGLELSDSGELAEMMTFLLQTSASFSLRGGTREIIRGIIARGLGLR